MKMPKIIRTRQVALIRELGYDEADVIADSFDEEGFELLGTHPHGVVIANSGELLRTRVPWPDCDRAMQANLADFAETFGMTVEEWRQVESATRAATSE